MQCYSCRNFFRRNKMVEVAVLTESKPSGVNGGSTTAGTWEVRTLNNLSGNFTQNWCSLNTITNEFTLKSGKYLITAEAVAVGVGSHQLRIRQINNNTSDYGLSSLSHYLTPSNSSTASITDYVNINANRTFALEHYFEKSVANFGKGYPSKASGNSEVYATVTIQRL